MNDIEEGRFYLLDSTTKNKTKLLYARDYTPQFVDSSVLRKMWLDCTEYNTLFDFEDTFVLERDLDTLAEIILDKQVRVFGLDDESLEILNIHINKLSGPTFTSLDDFIAMFRAKFPLDTFCIWDKSLDDSLSNSDCKISLVQLLDISKNRVQFRLYKSHMLEPKIISMYGGIDDSRLYTVETIHITDFLNKDVLFRYPTGDREEIIMDLLCNIESTSQEGIYLESI